MFVSNRSTSTVSRQDHIVTNRRPEADARRILSVARAMAAAAARGDSGMTPNEVTVYLYLVTETYVQPIVRGESDKIGTTAPNYSEIGRRLGMDRNKVRLAIRSLIESGYLRHGKGRIWAACDRFLELAAEGERQHAAEVADDLEIRHVPGERNPFADPIRNVSPPDTNRIAGPIRNVSPPTVEPAPPRAPVCAGARSGLNSKEGEEEDPGYIYHPEEALESSQDSSIQDDIYINNTNGNGISPEDEAWVIAFCDERFPMKALAENLFSNTRGLYPSAWYRKAVKRAFLARVPRWKYIKEIMETWVYMGAPDPGPEDRFDDDMRPVAAPRGPDVIPIETAPARPAGRIQQTMDMVARMDAANKAGVDWLKLD